MLIPGLPDFGRVLGIDVGYSPTRPTTAFCSLSWTPSAINLLQSRATADRLGREQALHTIRGTSGLPFLGLAIDGPLRPGLDERLEYRTAECLLSRRLFQKRGKPGQTNAGSGPQLHKHATMLAKLALESCPVSASIMPFSMSTLGVYEAFPNLFLGVLCAECEYPNRPRQRRRWTDCLFPLVAGQLDRLIESLLPGRQFQGVAATIGHEPVAALTCAITALVAAAGEGVAVGSQMDGFIVLPPYAFWGVSANGKKWAERELRAILERLSREESNIRRPQIYEGAVLLDWAPS